MKIMLISSGSKLNGATERAVTEAKNTIKALGAEFEIFHLYSQSNQSCSGCGGCKANGICVHGDYITEIAQRVAEFDGYIFFSPVHYGGASGSMKSALGRIFMSQKKSLLYKPAAAISASRRGGNFTAIEEITRFFGFASMLTVSGNYPGIIHGASYEEAEFDLEGLQAVRSTVRSMIWIINCIKSGENIGISTPKEEEKIKTSFIR